MQVIAVEIHQVPENISKAITATGLSKIIYTNDNKDANEILPLLSLKTVISGKTANKSDKISRNNLEKEYRLC